MLKRILLTMIAICFISAPAVAGHCPKDAKAIEHALTVVSVSDEVKSQVTELKDKAMEMHKAGDHEKSEDTLAEAMRTLLSALK